MKFEGQVRVGQRRRRGIVGSTDAICSGYKNIDVTSGSHNKINGLAVKEISPLKLGPVLAQFPGDATVYRVAEIFENFWQYGKAWPKAGHLDARGQPTACWHEFQQKGYSSTKCKRRPLPLKTYGTPTTSFYFGQQMDYLTSRRQIYVPFYTVLIRQHPVILALRKELEQGKKIMIIDNDIAPVDCYPQGIELTEQNWNFFLNDFSRPFGHGYVIAGVLTEII